jgi:hypothetical protein
MGHQKLIEDLRAVGYDSQIKIGDGNTEYVSFDYRIPVGAHAGEVVQVGLRAPDWPINPPGGPHVAPRIQHPGDNAHHGSPLGAGWIYWSRPHPEWTNTSRTVGEYLAHLRTLFAQFVEAAA